MSIVVTHREELGANETASDLLAGSLLNFVPAGAVFQLDFQARTEVVAAGSKVADIGAAMTVQVGGQTLMDAGRIVMPRASAAATIQGRGLPDPRCTYLTTRAVSGQRINVNLQNTGIARTVVFCVIATPVQSRNAIPSQAVSLVEATANSNVLSGSLLATVPAQAAAYSMSLVAATQVSDNARQLSLFLDNTALLDKIELPRMESVKPIVSGANTVAGPIAYPDSSNISIVDFLAPAGAQLTLSTALAKANVLSPWIWMQATPVQ